MTSESPNSGEVDSSPTCGHPTKTGGSPCQRTVSASGEYCYLHAEDASVPDAHGAPDGNTNAAEHGLHMSVTRRLEWFTEEQRELFEDYYVEYYGKAETSSQAARLASLAVLNDRLERHLFTEGVFYEKEVGDTGDVVKMPKSSTLEAYADTLRELRLGLEYEGISGAADMGGGTPHEGASVLWEDDD